MDDASTKEYTFDFNAPASEVSETFIGGMFARMGMSWFKYGAVADAYPARVNAIESLLLRLVRYMGADAFAQAATNVIRKMESAEQAPHRRASGNTEYLIDAANFAMIEFMRPRVEGAYFEPTDSTGSPGRVWNAGGVGQGPNTQEKRDQQKRARKTALGQFRDGD